MPLTFEFEFAYSDDPGIALRVTSPVTASSWVTFAYIDTGAQRTILDSLVAEEIGLELTRAEKIVLLGLGGTLEAVVAEVEISLLGEPELTFRLPVRVRATDFDRIGKPRWSRCLVSGQLRPRPRATVGLSGSRSAVMPPGQSLNR